MKSITKICAILIMLTATYSAGAISGPTSLDIQDNNLRWETAFNSGKSDDLIRLYTENAIVMAPSLEIYSSPGDIEKFWSNKIDIASNFRVEIIAMRIEGDTAYQTAIWVAAITSNGVTNDVDGEMMNILQRQEDGSWKISLQSWN